MLFLASLWINIWFNIMSSLWHIGLFCDSFIFTENLYSNLNVNELTVGGPYLLTDV